MKAKRLVKAVRNLERAPEVVRCMGGSPDWSWLVPAYLGVKTVDFPVQLRMRGGDHVALATFHDLVTAWLIFFRHEYDVRATDRVIVDAGANIGMFSLFAARTAPNARIVALEPFPSTRDRLLETLRANGLEGRVQARSWALAKDDARRKMDDQAGVSQSRGMFGADANRGVDVEAISLETLLAREKVNEVDLLKMDIEGSEHEVLLGTSAETLGRVKRLALEYHPNKPKGPLFAKLLASQFELHVDRPAGPDSGVAEFRRTRRVWPAASVEVAPSVTA